MAGWLLQVRAPLQDLLVWPRVNHFPEAKQLTRKDLLAKHLQRYQVSLCSDQAYIVWCGACHALKNSVPITNISAVHIVSCRSQITVSQ